jgi:sigma-B regulation protein RsbU (phosphoserine phosphatase)
MKTILLVEDEAGHAELMRRALVDADYAVTVTASLAEARAAIAQQLPDLALTDHNLPDGAGSALIAQVAGGFPILLMTAHGDEHLAVQAIKAGALDYLVKSPAMFADLPHTVERALREWKLEMERRQMLRALRDSEERYRRITEGLTDYLYSVRVEAGRTVATIHSLACVAVTGYTAQEFAADPFLWLRMIVPDDRDRIAANVQRVLAGEQPPPMEHRIVRKDGNTRWVSDTPILHRDIAGRLASYDGVVRDITERKEAEAAREHLIASLQHALANVKTLTSLLPICSGCKKIRDDGGYWNQVESYLAQHAGTRFTHGMCPDCIEKYFPGVNDPEPFKPDSPTKR